MLRCVIVMQWPGGGGRTWRTFSLAEELINDVKLYYCIVSYRNDGRSIQRALFVSGARGRCAALAMDRMRRRRPWRWQTQLVRPGHAHADWLRLSVIGALQHAVPPPHWITSVSHNCQLCVDGMGTSCCWFWLWFESSHLSSLSVCDYAFCLVQIKSQNLNSVGMFKIQ